MTFGRRIKFSRLLIPNRPVRTRCGNCGEERDFRLLTSHELTHFWYLLQWDFDENNFRVCEHCGHAYAMTVQEWRRLFPFYEPLARKQRRRLVFAVVWVPAILYIAYWHFSR